MNDDAPAKSWVPLDAPERRILGVMIEKQKTTPEYYPMSIAGIVTACNQKSNRDPVTQYDSDDVEDTLQSMRHKGVAVMVEGSGRVTKWKHAAYDWLGLKGRPVEMAVLAELLLRGPQTEGELRSRASRMDELPDLPALQSALAYLNERGLVAYLSPPGQKRGVVVAHALYPPAELERLREAARISPTETNREHAANANLPGRPIWSDEADAIKSQIADLQSQIERLADELHQLKSSLGA